MEEQYYFNAEYPNVHEENEELFNLQERNEEFLYVQEVNEELLNVLERNEQLLNLQKENEEQEENKECLNVQDENIEHLNVQKENGQSFYVQQEHKDRFSLQKENNELFNVQEENEEPSNEKCEANKKRKSLNKIRSLLSEMLETERRYVKDLEEICQFYLPLSRDRENFLEIGSLSLDRSHRRKRTKQVINERRSLQESLDVSNKIKEMEISTFDARVMLANIEELKDYHKRVVLEKMENAGDDASLLRELFTDEVTKMKVKYGRYCINKAKSCHVVNNNWEYLNQFQTESGICHRIDAQLIKPVQRLTRYHMFLSSLSEASTGLGETSSALDYRLAQAAVLEAANHTNTLMWIGQLTNSPLDLSRQGNLLKHGPVKMLSSNVVSSSLAWAVWDLCKQSQDSHLFLFQQTLLICKVFGDKLIYKWHVNINKVCVKEVKIDSETCFHLVKKTDIVEDTDTDTDTDRRKDRRMVILQCNSLQEKDGWVQAINREISFLDTLTMLLADPIDKAKL